MSHTPKHPEDKLRLHLEGFCSSDQSVLSALFVLLLLQLNLDRRLFRNLCSITISSEGEGNAGCNQITGGQSSSCQTQQRHFLLQTGLVSAYSKHFFYTRTMKVIVEYGKLNEAFLLFSLSDFFPTSE